MNDAAKRLPGSLKADPRLDSWIAVNADETVTVRTGKVEYGQGIMSAVAQIGAEELDVALARVRVQMADTEATANERLTAGSGSVEQSGTAVRHAAAHARAVLVGMAAEKLGVAADALTVEDGTVRSPATNQQITYWELMGGKPFGVEVTGEAAPKAPAAYTLVGTPAPRLDLPAKVTGGPAFIQDMEMAGLLHGRVVRPPSYHARLEAVDLETAKLPGVVEVVRDGRFLGVVAEREDTAIRAADALKAAARWHEDAMLPDEDRLYDWLVSQETEDFLIEDGVPQEDAPIPDIAEPGGAAVTVEGVYGRPYIAHASIGPSAGIARWDGEKLTVWSHTQGLYPLRAALACAFDMPVENIHGIHAENAGCYGHNGADDAAMDAAMLARRVPGRPVRVQWSREDENRWEPYGSAMVVMAQASLDAEGRILDWNQDVWSNAHAGRPRARTETAGFIAAWHRETPTPPPAPADNQGKDGGAHRGARPYYDIAPQRIVKHLVKPHPFRVSSLRALGTFGNIFAIESLMDELAHASGQDPVAFRLRHLSDARARDVVEKAAEMIGWDPDGWGGGRGQGLAFNRYKNEKCYAAVAVEVEVDADSGAVRVPRAVIAGDCGQVINPVGVANQLEGGVIQAASWTLKEAVRFDPVRVTSVDWETYPILTFRETPEVETYLFDRPDEKPLGVGEATQGPPPAAIANGIFHATGVRMRELPLTPDRVRAMLSGGT